MSITPHRAYWIVAASAFVAISFSFSRSFASGDFDGDGDVDYVDFESFTACLGGPGAMPLEGCEVDADFDNDGDADLVDYAVFQEAFNAAGVEAALPAKTISFELIGIHDPGSENYDDDCIGCHGERTEEVALDGVTPAAHGRMPLFFGSGNGRCLFCHRNGVDFLSRSAGGLREQVNIEEVQCTWCHGPTGVDRQWYMRE